VNQILWSEQDKRYGGRGAQYLRIPDFLSVAAAMKKPIHRAETAEENGNASE